MNELKYRKRKPDKETELLRMWKTEKDSEEAKEIDLATKDGSFGISYKGMKLQICGFNLITNKITNKLIFAYKFKHEEKFVIYYVPNNNKEGQKCLESIQTFIKLGGYGLQNMEEQLKSMYAEYGGKNGKK